MIPGFGNWWPRSPANPNGKNLEKDLEKILIVLNADMSGENTALTKGSYLMERYPDPAAFHSPRPEAYAPAIDRHTGWPMRPLDIDPYPGHFSNDFFLSVLEPFARQHEWYVAQNPYEGGSDHDVFLPLKVPTLLSWHYPDYFMGTNFDTADKVDPEEMKRVALVHGLVALSLASATQKETLDFLPFLEKKADERFRMELLAAKNLLNDISTDELDGDGFSLDDQSHKEVDYLERWARWYDEAIQSVEKIPVKGAKETLLDEIQSTRLRCKERAAQIQRQLMEHIKALRKEN